MTSDREWKHLMITLSLPQPLYETFERLARREQIGIDDMMYHALRLYAEERDRRDCAASGG